MKMNNPIIFTITQCNTNHLPLISIKTKSQRFKIYNCEKVSALRVFEKMEHITANVNAENFGVLFEIG